MKKKIPLFVLETIEPFVNRNGERFESIDPNGFLIKFIDKDVKSDFYFNVESFKMENGIQLLIDTKPTSKQTLGSRRTWIKAAQLESIFVNWVSILDGYEKVKSIYDDPILEAFAQEYYTEFEIVEENAALTPLTTKQILLLDEHLEHIQNKIDEYKTEENKTEIQSIQSEIIELRENITKKSKKWVIKNLTQVWAKITKQGPKLMKEFLSDTKKIAIKEGVKIVIEKGFELLTQNP